MTLQDKITADGLAAMLAQFEDLPVVLRIGRTHGIEDHALYSVNTDIDYKSRRATAYGDIDLVRVRITGDETGGAVLTAGRLANDIHGGDPVKIVLEDDATFLIGKDVTVAVEDQQSGRVIVITTTDTDDA